MMITSFGSFVVSQRRWYDERCHATVKKKRLWVNEPNRASKRVLLHPSVIDLCIITASLFVVTFAAAVALVAAVSCSPISASCCQPLGTTFRSFFFSSFLFCFLYGSTRTKFLRNTHCYLRINVDLFSSLLSFQRASKDQQMNDMIKQSLPPVRRRHRETVESQDESKQRDEKKKLEKTN